MMEMEQTNSDNDGYIEQDIIKQFRLLQRI